MYLPIGTRFLLPAVGVLVLVLGAAGCGGDDDTGSSSPPPATASEAACSLLTAADATTLFAVPAQPKIEGQAKRVASQCFYETAALDGQLLQFRIFDSARYYSEDLVDGEPIRGLGAGAYIDTMGPDGIVDLQFVRDGKVFALAYSNSAGDAATRAAGLEQLARVIDDRL